VALCHTVSRTLPLVAVAVPVRNYNLSGNFVLSSANNKIFSRDRAPSLQSLIQLFAISFSYVELLGRPEIKGWFGEVQVF
jgi:hypothetical protein